MAKIDVRHDDVRTISGWDHYSYYFLLKIWNKQYCWIDIL